MSSSEGFRRGGRALIEAQVFSANPADFRNLVRDLPPGINVEDYREATKAAHRIAKKIGSRAPAWISFDDLYAAALLGLTQATGRFNSKRGEPFLAFAKKRIRGAVMDELRSGDILPRRERQKVKRGEAVAPQQVDFENAAKGAIDRTPTPAEHYERGAEARLVRRAVSRLPDERLRLVCVRYFFDEDTQVEIAKELKVVGSRVSQLLKRALDLLQDELPAAIFSRLAAKARATVEPITKPAAVPENGAARRAELNKDFLGEFEMAGLKEFNAVRRSGIKTMADFLALGAEKRRALGLSPGTMAKVRVWFKERSLAL